MFGRVHEALAVLRAERSPSAHVHIAETLLGSGDPQAVDYFATAVDACPASARLRMALADALARSEQGQAALDAARAAIDLAGDDPTYVEAGARIAVEVGAYEDAAVYGRRLLEAGAVSGHEILGQLALFRGDAAAAASHAEAMLATGDDVAALTLRGAARALLERRDEAMADLDAALRIDPGASVARTWRAEIALRQGRYTAALDDGERASGSAAPAARMVRELAEAALVSQNPQIQQRPEFWTKWGEVWGAVHAVHAGMAPPEEPDAAVAETAVRRALATMRGNRTAAPSYVAAGELRRLRFRPGPRVASRRLLDLVRVTAAHEILTRFDEVIAEFPDTGLPRAHRAELYLWLGDYDAARADFDGVIALFPKTRWAYIGLATLESIQGEPARALETLALGIRRMDNTTGPAVYGVRGEALRRLGRLDEAVRDLETAVELAPQRLSAWIESRPGVSRQRGRRTRPGNRLAREGSRLSAPPRRGAVARCVARRGSGTVAHCRASARPDAGQSRVRPRDVAPERFTDPRDIGPSVRRARADRIACVRARRRARAPRRCARGRVGSEELTPCPLPSPSGTLCEGSSAMRLWRSGPSPTSAPPPAFASR